MVEGRSEGQRKNLAPGLYLVRLPSPLSPSRLVPDGARAIASGVDQSWRDDQLGVYWENIPYRLFTTARAVSYPSRL
jgi:hypothetical protein